MHARTTWVVLSLSAVLAAPATAQITSGTAPGTFTGPSSSQTPYVIPSISGWNTLSLISVADAAKDDGYVMVGIPDGLGAVRVADLQAHYALPPPYVEGGQLYIVASSLLLSVVTSV